mmetsp:Transcript_17864/g.46206  ORF Transcript_17864/g.46206 Transcript_17864/m.46206 type:complete len:209 (-) Transcript_17864:433-1059(-)
MRRGRASRTHSAQVVGEDVRWWHIKADAHRGVADKGHRLRLPRQPIDCAEQLAVGRAPHGELVRAVAACIRCTGSRVQSLTLHVRVLVVLVVSLLVLLVVQERAQHVQRVHCKSAHRRAASLRRSCERVRARALLRADAPQVRNLLHVRTRSRRIEARPAREAREACRRAAPLGRRRLPRSPQRGRAAAGCAGAQVLHNKPLAYELHL